MEQKIERGRLKKAMSEEVAEIMVAPTLCGEPVEKTYQLYIDVNKAHVLMLAHQGIIAKDAAAKILAVAQEMAAMGNRPDFPLTPKLEEMYFNLENYLIGRVGMEIGGQQHTARSRNDIHAVVDRMTVRNALLALEGQINKFRRTLLDLARRNTDAVMSGYTHLQPSEPITFAHYLSAVCSALERDFARIDGVWPRLNLNPLGGGSMGSTTWPIDRRMTAKLLGFDGIVENSLDCVCSRDYLLELMSAAALLASTLARLSTDMRIWAAPEYGYIEVSDDCAVCSSIMPQKKNPWTFESCASFSARVKGASDAAWMTYKGVPYAFTMESMDAISNLWPCMNDVNGMLRLLDVTMTGVTFRRERALSWAGSNFSTVTELANSLVREDHLSFRAAHEIVAHAVGILHDKNENAAFIKASMLNDISMELFGKRLSITDEAVARALDPAKNVESKTVEGGTSPKEVNRQLDILEKRLFQDQEAVEMKQSSLAEAKRNLEAEVEAFVSAE